MVEMSIVSLKEGLMTYHRVVILKDKEKDRYLPIFIGPAEFEALRVKLQGVEQQRPLTHDLLRSMIEVLGATVSHILIDDLKKDTFYAKIVLNVDGEKREVDSRPSDALALAVRTNVPIYSEESVLENAGLFLSRDKETGEPIIEERPHEGSEPRDKKTSDEEIKRLSAFRDFVDNLDLDDFDKKD